MAAGGRGAGSTLKRVTTGVEGLDQVLGGGLFESGLYIVQGALGTGKTILANQICFHQARLGRRAVYVTLLGESHDRMLQHLASLEFTDLSLLPDRVLYLSGASSLDDAGLGGLLALIRGALRRSKPFLLVLDGLYVAQEHGGSGLEFRRFVYELQGEASLHGCTMIFLTNVPTPAFSPEQTMVDGLIELHDDLVEARAVRSLHVRKLRGGAFLRGRHAFRIQERGIVAFPRLETLVRDAPESGSMGAKLGTGVDGLDRMLAGGVPAASTTLVAGPSGSGKTTLGLLFLARSTPEAPGLFFGCYESPGEVRVKAEAIGIDIDRLLQSGALRLVWQPPFESFPDEMGQRLLDEVRGLGARRVLIDGSGAFKRTVVSPGRLNAFFTALSIQLRAEGVTTFCTAEAHGSFAPEQLVLDEISAVAENVVLLRFAEHRSRLLRLLSIIKVRQSGFDTAVVPFEIGSSGITLQKPLADTEALVSGSAHRIGGAERAD